MASQPRVQPAGACDDDDHAEARARDSRSRCAGPAGSHRWRAVQRVYRAASRASAIAFSLRVGLHGASLLLKRRRSHGARGKVADSVRWAAAVGAFSTVYVICDECLRSLIGNTRSAGFRAALSAFLAAPSILITGAATHHDELALYVLLRALTLLVRCANRDCTGRTAQWLLAPTRWSSGDVAMICVATWQILLSYCMLPASLPPAYVAFLNKMAGFEPGLLSVLKDLAFRNAAAGGAGVEGSGAGAAAGPPENFCSHLHPHVGPGPEACTAHFLQTLPTLLHRALYVYAPIYAASAVTVHRRQLLTAPAEIARKAAVGTLRSATFLAVFVGLAHRVVCMANYLPGRVAGVTPAKLVAVAWLPGLALLIEKGSRRMELSLYCLCRALLTFRRALLLRWPRRRVALAGRTDVLVLAVACAGIMHCYSDDFGRHRCVFRSKYLNVLDFVFGAAGLHSGHIAHAQSTRELLKTASVAAGRNIRRLSVGNLVKLSRDGDDAPADTDATATG